jgi:hypothetical protein
MLMEAIAAGYLEGEEAVLRRGNSQHRKKLRRHDKTKAGNRDKAAREQAIKNRDATRRIAEAGDAFIGPSAVVPGSWPKAWIDGVYTNVDVLAAASIGPVASILFAVAVNLTPVRRRSASSFI